MEEKQYIITIQREFGSLGRPIAKKLSEILNIEYYDRDILEMASKELKINKSEISEYDEKSYKKMKYPLGRGDTKIQDHLFNVQQCIISELAMKRKSCIIVGRCSDYVLRHLDNTFNIFIYAPYEKRLENCIKELGMQADEARKMIKSIDKARKNYHKYYTGLPVNTTENRQMFVDSSFLGVDGTAKMLAEVVKEKFEISKPETLKDEK